MLTRNNLYIPSIDAKDLYIANNRKYARNGYTLRTKAGKKNLRKYINSFDYSLDLIELREVAAEVYAGTNESLSFIIDDKEYSSRVINVTFKYSVKEYNRNGANTYIKFGYTVDESDFVDNCVVKDGELVAIKIGVPCFSDMAAKYLPKYMSCEHDELTGEYFYRLSSTMPTLFTKMDLRKWIYTGGFKCDGIKYCRFKRSSGAARVGKCLFIDERLYPAMHKSEQCGLTYTNGDPIDLAALESYISLTSSSIIDTIEIAPENILVIPDYESKFTEDAVCTELDDKNRYVTVEREMDISNSIWDGQGLIDKSLMGKYKKKGCLLLRNKFFKSCCFNTNIQKFFRDKKIRDISQIHGITTATSIKDIKLILTPSSIKYFKFGDYDVWLKNIHRNFGIVKYDKPTHFFGGKYVQAHYQLINTLQMSEEEVGDLVHNELEYLSKINTDVDAMRYHLGMHFNNGGDFSNIMPDRREIVYRMLRYDCGFENTKIYNDFRHDLVESYKKNMKKGHILVDGTYATLVGNPYEMLLQVIGKFDGTSLIEPGTIYNKRYPNGTKLLGSRSPHVTMGNVLLTTCKNYKKIDRYFNFTENIMAINSINENILERLSGADFDSDQCLITDNEIMIAAAERNYDVFKVPTRNVPPDGKKNRTYTPESMADLDIVTGTNKIGEIVNLSQEVNSLLWDVVSRSGVSAAECFEDIRDLYYDACQLDVMSNIEIDMAKKEFPVKNVKELRRLRDKYKNLFTNFDDRMIKPKFFGFIAKTKGFYDPQRKAYQHHNTSMDYLYDCVQRYRSKQVKKSELTGIAEIFKPADYDKNFVYKAQIDKIIEKATETTNEIKTISTYKMDADDKAKLIEFARVQLMNYVNRLNINQHTMYRILRWIDEQKNNAVSNALFYVLFNYRNFTLERQLYNLPVRTTDYHLENFAPFGKQLPKKVPPREKKSAAN